SVVGYYGHGNFGDDLILETLVRALLQEYKVDVIFVGNELSDSFLKPTENLQIQKVKTIKAPFFSKINIIYHAFQVLRLCRKSDYFVYGGGTQIFETKKNSYYTLINKLIYLFF